MSEARDKTAGFIGLGMMGSPMAENILKAGHPLVVYDIDPPKTARFAALGAHVADGPAEVARRAAIVVSMVDTTAQAEEVIVGPSGVIQGAQPGDVVVSMSTIDDSNEHAVDADARAAQTTRSSEPQSQPPRRSLPRRRRSLRRARPFFRIFPPPRPSVTV